MSYKTHKYKGYIFEVYEPKDCQIAVKSKGLPDGNITIHEATGSFREDVLGWGTDQANLESALSNVCNRMIQRGKKSNRETKCKEMDEFFSNLTEND